VEGLGYYESPLGVYKITSRDEEINAVELLRDVKVEENITPVIQQCKDELDEYFSRGRKFFTVPLNPEGTTFQNKVWSELQEIPFGTTINYSELSQRVGDLKAIRAVGLANGQNPIAIIIPCHRVIGKDGNLVGYAGGLDKKEWLLEHEGIISKQLKMF
jgi:methylated-DNA-[protein]-cysteine S-methyltransferase